MTLEHADGFFAWDVVSYLAIFIVLFLCILIYDAYFGKSVAPSENSQVPKKSWLHFLIYGKFNKSVSIAHKPFIVRLSAELFPVLLLVFLLRGFIAEPFRIPSNSMMPTLLTGDFVFVNKMSYGLRLPLTNTVLLPLGEVKRGDPVVFRYPNYENIPEYKGIDFIKRVIGIPGDVIEYANDTLTINGEQVTHIPMGTYQSDKRSANKENGYDIVLEQNNEEGYTILKHPSLFSQPARLVVPEGHYFVMGDNRRNSSDSRFWGFVPDEYILGKAKFVWMNYDEGFNLGRIGRIK